MVGGDGVLGRLIVLVTRKIRGKVIARGVWVFQQVDQLPVRFDKGLQEPAIFAAHLPRFRRLLKLFQLFQLVDVQWHPGTFVGFKFLLQAVRENVGRVDSPKLP